MISTFGSSDMSLSKFDKINFNLLEEQRKDYLIVCGQIDPIEHEKVLTMSKPEECAKLD
jgi:hypothetical protein